MAIGVDFIMDNVALDTVNLVGSAIIALLGLGIDLVIQIKTDGADDKQRNYWSWYLTSLTLLFIGIIILLFGLGYAVYDSSLSFGGLIIATAIMALIVLIHARKMRPHNTIERKQILRSLAIYFLLIGMLFFGFLIMYLPFYVE